MHCPIDARRLHLRRAPLCAVAAGLLAFSNAPARAQFGGRGTPPPAPPAPAAQPLSFTTFSAAEPAALPTSSAPPLPLRDVVLFSSGVGYFGHAGRIRGAGAFDMAFRPAQINDVLKSLVIFDPAGQVRPVAYGIEDFVTRRPRTTDLAVGSGDTLGALLRRLQGAPVRLEIANAVVEGRIVSVSSKRVPVPGQPSILDVEAVTVLTASGLRTVSLEEVSQVRLLDARLDRKLREGLERIASGIASELDDGRRPLQLRFAEGGEREVRAGYLQEAPLWKTSYRLVLDNGRKARPLLQGWAIVENTTEQDWSNVRLSLVSGRPVSFIQNLYQPLYISRPLVAPQILGSPRPQTYGETLNAIDPQNALLVPGQAEADVPRSRQLTPGMAQRGGNAFMNSGQFAAEDQERRQDVGAAAEQLAKSVAAQAEGSERGELFEYAIKGPVTLRRGQAAMVPIISDDIEGQKLSILDAGSNVMRAVYGFRLKNTTGLHLSGGPLTVFQDGIYAGDAQINNVQPGESRLISYAVDLDLVVGREEPRFAQDTVSISAKSGVLLITRKQNRTQTYTFRNKSDQAKTVVVQQPIESDWKLAPSSKPLEKSPTEYRFQVNVPAGKSAELRVQSEQPVSETVALLDADLDVLIQYARNGEVSAALRAALGNLVARRRKISEVAGRRAAVEAELKEIGEDQSRIRNNMSGLNRDSALYKGYVDKLLAQEARIERLREEVARLRDAEAAAQRELRTFVDGLDIA